MRRGILNLVGGRVAGFERVRCLRRPIEITPSVSQIRRVLADRRIAAIDRLGKRVLLVFDDQSRLMFEPRMTGLVLLSAPPTQEHLRVRLLLEDKAHRELLYWDRRGLGSVRWFSQADFEHEFHIGRLGPDALQVDLAEFIQRFSSTRQAVKVALLDQQKIAGIGNLYAAEILHVAQINPGAACASITRQGWKKIYQAMRDVLEEAIRYEGSTLADGTYRNALNQSGSYQNQHRVYAKAGQVCPSCGKSEIVRIVQAQRATFFCPRCQRNPRV